MASVDDRIVAMHFDNNTFEKKLTETIGSLDKLKASLDFSNANSGLADQTKAIVGSIDRMKGSLDFSNSKRGLADLVLAGKNFNLAGIATALEGISSRFTALGAVAFSVIQNITDRAVNAGIQLGKALSLDQVISGFREYETNMNSIQTIMANTRSDATTLEDVNAALDQLNTYSDQTIYNFSQMARNIGTFTAAGIDLDTSVAGIKGIANLAAISGSNAEQASTAMYQLSQALASGTVKLIDWNSVVNAGMGGEVFQKALFETGKALGTIKDVPMKQTFEEWKDAGNTFRGSLEDGWITAEVLTNTLQGFTGDLTEAQILALGYSQEQTAAILEMGKVGKEAATKVKTLTQLISTVKESIGSGWSSSFRIIIGDFEEARTMWTNVSDTLGTLAKSSAEARNQLLNGWEQLGGRRALIQGISNAFDALLGILGPIKAAFRDIFPKMTAMRLVELTRGFRNLMERLTPTPAVAALITRTFRGIFSVFSIGISIVKGIAGVFGDLFEKFNPSNDANTGILGFTARIGDALYTLKQALVDGDQIKAFFEKIPELITKFWESLDFSSFSSIIDSFGSFKDLLTGIFDAFDLTALDGIKSFFSNLFGGTDPEFTNSLAGGFGTLGERLIWLWERMKDAGGVFQWFWEKFGTLKDTVVNVISGIASAIAEIDFVQMFSDAILSEEFDKVLELVQTVLAGIFVGAFSGFQKKGIGLNLDLTGGFLTNLSKTTQTIGTSFEGVTKALNGLTGVLTTMQANIKADTLLKIGIGIALLTASVLVLSMIDAEALGKALSSMAAGFGELIGVMVLLSILISGPMTAVKLGLMAAGLILLSTAMVVMSIALKTLSGLNWEELAKGLIGIAGILGVMALVVKSLSANSAGMITAGLGMIAIATAMNIMALAVKSFAEMDWESMGKGLLGIAGALIAVTVAMNLMPEKGMISAGIGILAISVALNIMALAVKSFAEMDWVEMGKGLAGVAAVLLILAGALAIMPNGALLALQGVGLLAIGIGLFAMSMAIRSLAGMKWAALGKGIAGIAATLLVLAGAMAIMQGSILGAVAIAILAPALIVLALAIKAFSKLTWGEIIKGIIGLALALGVLALAAHLMSTATVVLLGLGAALLLIGAGFALFGVGAALVASAFALIADAGVDGVKVLLLALEGLVTRLPSIIVAFGEGILLLAKLVIAALPEIIASFSGVIGALLQLIIDNTPKLGEVFKTLILTALDVVKEVSPDIIATGFQLLMDFLKGISDNIEEITTTVIDIVTKFLDTVADHAEELVASGLGVLTSLLQGIADNIDDVVAAAVDVLVSFIEGIGEGALDLVVAGTGVITELIKGLGAAATSIVTAGAEALISFLQGISDNVQMVVDKGFEIVIQFIRGITDSINKHAPELRAAGWDLAVAIANGFTAGLASKAGSIGSSLLDTFGGPIGPLKRLWELGSPSRLTRRMAEWIIAGFTDGLDDDLSVVRSTQRFGVRATNAFEQALSEIPAMLDGLNEFNPTITPVLDLTQVKNEAGKLSGLLGNIPNVQGTLSYDQARLISSDTNALNDEPPVVAQDIGPREVKFEQNNYSPEALSANDIYRNTRNQIAMAKEELSVA